MDPKQSIDGVVGPVMVPDQEAKVTAEILAESEKWERAEMLWPEGALMTPDQEATATAEIMAESEKWERSEMLWLEGRAHLRDVFSLEHPELAMTRPPISR